MDDPEVSHSQAVTAAVGGLAPFPWGRILSGDCLSIAPTLPPAILDLLYIDPPFFTKKDHTGSQQGATFTDRWKGGRAEYLAWLDLRIRALRPLLKPTGIFLLHLDWHAVHYAKVLCDQIFGDDAFQNELIWYYQTGGASKGRFSRKHDTILMYANDPAHPFYFDGPAIAIPRTPKAMKRAQNPTGARINASDTHKNPDDVLLISAINPMARERTGYPTQKPLALLQLLIKALCPPDGAVGDFFSGSGTTLVAAQSLHRQWIGCDANPAAIHLAQKRLANPSPK